ADDADNENQPDGNRNDETRRMDRLAGDLQHDEHDDIANELDRESRADGREHDNLMRERDLPDHAGIARETERTALQRFLRREPRPQRDGDEGEEALAGER